jgi:hypothetical protein
VFSRHHVDPFNRLVGGVVEQVELRSSLLLVTGLELIGEEFVQPQHRSISDHYVSKSVDVSVNSIRDSDLVEATLDEVTEILCKSGRQAVIEATTRDRLISCRVVTASEL